VAFELELERGRALTAEGDFGHALFAIESGTADVVSEGVLLRKAGPGDVVGEVAVLRPRRRIASIISTSPMRVLVVRKRDVRALEREAPEAARRLRALIEEHLGAPAVRGDD
jgi:CRP-like cAMP-binding protein